MDQNPPTPKSRHFLQTKDRCHSTLAAITEMEFQKIFIPARNTDESIAIGVDVEITVLEANGKTINLGVSASRASNLPEVQFLTKNEAMRIGDDIEVNVFSINGREVQLGSKSLVIYQYIYLTCT